MKRKWLKEEENYLINNYSKISIEEISKELNREKNSIQRKACRMGLSQKASETWSNEELATLRKEYPNNTIKNIVAMLPNRNENAILLKANRLGLKKEKRDNSNMGKYSVNKDYFKEIDTHNKAYFLGWAVTDGNIVRNKNNNQYRIRLQSNDVDILEKFLKDTESTTQIYEREYGKYSEVNICDREFVENLEQYGFTNCKTYSIEFPNIKEEFVLDFIKGCFDGDGSYVCTDKTKRISFVREKKNFIEQLNKTLHKYGVSNLLYQKDNYYVIEINSKKSIKKFIEYMLQTESYFLDRKLNKMKSLLENC